MRVISGTARGRRLAGPPAGAATRPTSDKVRGAIFNIVAAAVPDARVLDLFAGTGALGIEALSRGASHAVFVEADRGLCRTITRNLETVGMAGQARVLCRDVRRAAGALAPGPFDLVFIDPPYGHGLESEALAVLVQTALLAPDAVVVLEHDSRTPPQAPPAGLSPELDRTYGDTALTIYRYSTDGAAGPVPRTPPDADAEQEPPI